MTTPPPASLEWEHAPFRALFRLAWPIVVSMLSVSTMTLVDTLFVSRLGSAAVAGVGLAGVLIFSLWCFPMGVVRAVKILISQAVGAGRREQCGRYLGSALLTACVLGCAVTLIGMLGAPLLIGFTATEQSGQYAASYLSVRALGSLPFLLLIAVEETRHGFGDSRSVMVTTLLGNASNIVLDYCFIFLLQWGVEGAAWASNCALLLELTLLGSYHGYRSGFDLRGTRRRHLSSLLRLGVPSGIQFGMEVSSFAMVMLILSSFSERHTAANQIAVQVQHFSFLPAVAFGEAGSVLAGQAVGARRLLLVNTVARLTLQLALAYSTVCGLVFFLGANRIVDAFTSDADLFALTARLFLVLAVFQFFDSANIVVRGILRGTGDVRYVAFVGIIAAWLCTPPLTYLLGHQMGWGVFGAWIGVSVEVLIATTIFWRRLVRNHWHTAAIAAEARERAG